MSLPESAKLYLDSNRGVYIPRDFFQETRPECIKWACDSETKAWILDQCSNPDNESYWDAWLQAENDVTVIDGDVEYQIYPDDDLWLVPIDAEWPNEEL